MTYLRLCAKSHRNVQSVMIGMKWWESRLDGDHPATRVARFFRQVQEGYDTEDSLRLLVKDPPARRILFEQMFNQGTSNGQLLTLFCQNKYEHCLRLISGLKRLEQGELDFFYELVERVCRDNTLLNYRMVGEEDRILSLLKDSRRIYSAVQPSKQWGKDHANRIVSNVVQSYLQGERRSSHSQRVRDRLQQFRQSKFAPLSISNVLLCHTVLSQKSKAIIVIFLRDPLQLIIQTARSIRRAKTRRDSRESREIRSKSTSKLIKPDSVVDRKPSLKEREELVQFYRERITVCSKAIKVLKLHQTSAGYDERMLKLTATGVSLQGGSDRVVPLQNILDVLYIRLISANVVKKQWQTKFDVSLILTLKLSEKEKNGSLDLLFRNREEVRDWVLAISWLLRMKGRKSNITLGEFWWRVLRFRLRSIKGKKVGLRSVVQSLMTEKKRDKQEKKVKSAIKM